MALKSRIAGFVAALAICATSACNRFSRAEYSEKRSDRSGVVIVRTANGDIKKAEDANHDGKLDLVKTFHNNELVRVEQDRNADGQIDLVREYLHGEIQREIFDDNFDGKPEIIKTYRRGKLAIVEYDPDGCGWAHRIDYYDDNGKLIRSEVHEPPQAK